MQNKFISKNRYSIYYFRQSIPPEILNLFPSIKSEIRFSLKTKDRSIALIKARHEKIMYDFLFEDLLKSIEMKELIKEKFSDLSFDEQEVLLLKQRAQEAINDQQYTQQLFFLLERKDRIKKAFTSFDELKSLTLNDIDLSSVDKINHFIAIVDLLSSPDLKDPKPYFEELKLKSKAKIKTSNRGSRAKSHKSVKIGNLVLKRKKPVFKQLDTPTLIKQSAKNDREVLGNTVLKLVDQEFAGVDQNLVIEDVEEDIVLNNIELDSPEDIQTFSALVAMLEKGGSVNASDFEGFSKPVVVSKSMLKVSELFEKYYKEVSPEWSSQKTHTTNRSIYDSFLEIVGDKFVDQLDYDSARHFIDTLQKLPPNRKNHKQFKGKTVDQLLALTGTFTPMSPTNVNKNIEKLSSVFIYAERKKYIAKNIFDGMKLKNKVQRKKNALQRSRFEKEDLEIIFNSEEYQNDKFDRTYKFWLPLLGLYTGARIGELAQLRVNDIYTKDRVWVIDINDEEDKQVKTANSFRQIPIHKTLLSLGFVEYVKHLKKLIENEQLFTNHLFPDMNKGRDGYGHYPTKSFAYYLQKLGVKENGKSFHSLRHTFADEFKQNEVNPVMTAEILGHEVEGETMGRYGKGYRVGLKKVQIDKYSPLSPTQIKNIKTFRLWKEFWFKNTLSKVDGNLIDVNKSVFKNKNLHTDLAEALNIKRPTVVKRKPRKTETQKT